ncbi:hypothetical protein AWC25_00015 [Mycobacterium sherrisii]|nr:hypothetical protein AWC25_00015 [Mycobacterium sherrisii]
MVDDAIVQLHRQGYCTAYISLTLGVPSDYVRQVVAQASTPAQVRRAKAEKKRARALQLLSEVDSMRG